MFKQTAEKLAAVNRNDGKIRWTIPVATLTGQPVLGDRYVYISTFIQEEGEGTGKHTFSPTGTSPDSPLSEDIPEAEKLIKDLSAGISMQIKLTPILKAVDKATGNTVWTEKNVGGNIFCAKDRLFAVQRSNTFSLIDQKIGTLTLIYALNKDNGDLLWKYEHKGYIDSIAADESHLFFTSHQDTSGITEMMSFTGKAKSKLGNSISCISIVW
jgi:outer membrane protein assembly factor BamB